MSKTFHNCCSQYAKGNKFESNSQRNAGKALFNGAVRSMPKVISLKAIHNSDSAVKFIENKGITLLSKDLYVSDHRIAHALRDTKQRLSKAVSPEQLA